jgi:hypothetical protein
MGSFLAPRWAGVAAYVLGIPDEFGEPFELLSRISDQSDLASWVKNDFRTVEKTEGRRLVRRCKSEPGDFHDAALLRRRCGQVHGRSQDDRMRCLAAGTNVFNDGAAGQNGQT